MSQKYYLATPLINIVKYLFYFIITKLRNVNSVFNIQQSFSFITVSYLHRQIQLKVGNL